MAREQETGTPGRVASDAESEQAQLWIARSEVVVRGYLTRLLGPDQAEQPCVTALAELAAVSGSRGAGPDSSRVRSVVQLAGLDALEAQAFKLARPLRLGRARCAVARHLRARAERRISGHELVCFYRHLDRCRTCARIVRRFEASESYLQAAMRSWGSTRGVDAVAPDVVEGAQPRQTGTAGRVVPIPLESGGCDGLSPIPGQEPLNASVNRQAPAPRRSRSLVLVLSLILGAVGAAELSNARMFKASATSSVKARGEATAPITETKSDPPVLMRRARSPFILTGVRFDVVVNAQEAWTAFARFVSPGFGKQWELVTVESRNLTRKDFDPRRLNYRLVGAGDVNYFPNLAYGTAHRSGRAHPLAAGAQTRIDLAFAVPASATRLQLAFDPTGRPERVLVSLRP